MSYDIIGYSAISFGAISLLPQIIQMIKTKKVRDINIFFLIIALISDILYFVYSILDKDNIMFYSAFPPTLSHIIMLILWFLYNKQMVHDTTNEDIEIIII